MSSSLKEYLKRYSSSSGPHAAADDAEKGKLKKKKKRRQGLKEAGPAGGKGVVIVDIDSLWQKQRNSDEEEEEPEEGDEPVIIEDVEVKRMHRMEASKSYRPYLSVANDGSGWVTVQSDDTTSRVHLEVSTRGYRSINSQSRSPRDNKSLDLSPPRRRHDSPIRVTNLSKSGVGRKDSQNLSPPRKRVDSSDLSPLRKKDKSPERGSKRMDSPDLSPPRNRRNRWKSPNKGMEREKMDSPDLSPSRRRGMSPDIGLERRKRMDSPDLSPPRNRGKSPVVSLERRKSLDTPDLSPPRKRGMSPKVGLERRNRMDSPDLSPPRKIQKSADVVLERRKKMDSPGLSPPKNRGKSPGVGLQRRKRMDSPDLSPPRKRGKSPDVGLQRRKRMDSPDLSPPRKRGKSPDVRLQRKRMDSPDLSPPRKRGTSPDMGLQRRRMLSPDLSPPRKRGKSPDVGMQRRKRMDSPGLSTARKRHDSPDVALSRRAAASKDLSTSQTADVLSKDLSPSTKKASTRTMADGASAGLQSEKQVAAEVNRKKAAEAKLLADLDPSVSGQGAQTIFRDKRGRRLEGLEEMLRQQRGETKAPDQPLEWGKGLAQKQEAAKGLAELEANKSEPFARYRDDAELDKSLKERLRWGDPMAHLVKGSEVEPLLEDLGAREEMKASGFIVPQNIPNHSWLKRGTAPPPNRYNIRPGRHWDGVDRSTGYEQGLFKHQSEKKARDLEAYLWSVSDM